MQYSTLGETGLLVSRLAFGAMTFTAGDRRIGAVFKTEASVAEALVHHSIDAGINFFDTADTYASGQSEQLLGAALQGRRDEVVIATKVGGRTGAPLTQQSLSRRHILWSVDQSLKRLGTDWIDVYIVHFEDARTPLLETLSALDDIVRAGKVRYIGFSNWSAWKVAAAMEIQKANGLAPFTHGQMYYSLLCRDVEHEVVPMMRQYGLGLTVWSPLSGGFLSGKYTPETLNNPDYRYSGVDMFPFDKDHGFQLIERMRIIASNHGASVAQLAIAWLLTNPTVASVIVGASKLEQLEDNLGAADLVLNAEEIAELDAATSATTLYPNWYTENFADLVSRQALTNTSTLRR